MQSLRDRQPLRDRSRGLRPPAGLRNYYRVPCAFFYMFRLSFLSRVAFICNICLLLAIVMRYYSFVASRDLQSTILVSGLVLSFVMNGLVNILYAVLLFRKAKLGTYVPIWLAIINLLFLVFQFYLILAP